MKDWIQCPRCFQLMQLADEIRDTAGNVVSRRFICGNHPVPYQENVHAGDTTRTEGRSHEGQRET